MSTGQAASVSRHRAALRRRGIVRVEVQVERSDAELVRQVAKVLTDPGRSAEARALLRSRFAEDRGDELKAVLASGPLDDIEFDRPLDFGRDVEL
jgi:hypothetical protein